jgi:cell division protein FtsL
MCRHPDSCPYLVEGLETDKSALLSLERVEKIAREELKLEKAKEEQIVHDFNPNP